MNIVYQDTKIYIVKFDNSGLVDVYSTVDNVYLGTVEGIENAKEKFNG